MIRVLIADDESIIREGIKCLFDWESLGYTIAGEAANAINFISRFLPTEH